MKHLKYLKHTLATRACNIKEGREREVQPEKPTPGLDTPDLVISRAEVERRGGADVNSGHDLLVGNDSTSTLKALVWFWLIDETLSANLVYQSDYEIGSTTLSGEAMVIMT